MQEHQQEPLITLGDCLGKGAFGTVYRGLNMQNGETVAVKKIKLSKMLKTNLQVIQTEIELLKKLDHPNIVKYRGTFKTDDSLCLVLEYCENGSLHSICKSFGKMPEHLVAVYTSQVLQGLVYLHDQGVIHRDVKGANILTTKDGTLKLADFGVATQSNGFDDRAVVGSPYWMAPEVIELNGATTSSDVWSVGCTVIELLEGKPPYFDLDPAPALFRMVKDDHPPIPANISQAAKDFLLECFQKDPNLRVSSRKLLRHPWVKAHRITTKFSEAIDEVQRYNERFHTTAAFKPKPKQLPVVNTTFEDEQPQAQPLRPSFVESTRKTDVWDNDFILENDRLKNSTIEKVSYKHKKVQAKEVKPTASENWDTDYVGSLHIPDGVLQKSKKCSALSGNLKTSQSPAASKPLSESKNKDELTKIQRSSSNASNAHDPKKKMERITQRVPTKLTHSIDELNASHQRHFSAELKEPVPDNVLKYVETEKDLEYSDLFTVTSIKVCDNKKMKGLETVMLSKSTTMTDDTTDEDDIFDDIEESFEELDSEKRNALDRRTSMVERLHACFETLNSKTLSEREIAVEELDALLNEEPSLKSELLSHYGMISLVEILQITASAKTQLQLLRVIVTLVYNDANTLHKLCLSGGLSVILAFTDKKFPSDIRYETAIFVQQMCQLSQILLQIFLSGQGLQVLTQFLLEDYKNDRDLVIVGVFGVWKVLKHQEIISKNDVCRILVRLKAQEPLSKIFLKALASDDNVSKECLSHTADILLTLSQADGFVKESLASVTVLRRLLRVLFYLPQNVLVIMLKFIKNLSMVPQALDVLREVNAVQILTEILKESKTKSYTKEVINQALAALYNLCRLHRESQEIAVYSGVVPILQFITATEKFMKEFALPILFALPRAGKTCRKYLWHYHLLQFYINLLLDPNWQSTALDSISNWLQYETVAVKRVLCEDKNVSTIRKLISSCSNASLNRLVGSLCQICQRCPTLAAELCDTSVLIKIKERLATRKTRPEVLVSLLKLLKFICANNPSSHGLLSQIEMRDFIIQLYEGTDSILVKELTHELLDAPWLSRDEASFQYKHFRRISNMQPPSNPVFLKARPRK
ncbi:STE/STE11/CDC15 protein kinase Cdc7 [Schizosaccharomyces japonicus yFS275]|uniref:non-specific serine/threonine protein kinase n=1 Tax=Schizosaccharomyces japonicus (strain yFS275 / FY16936) TaxID=402676 RepID=B6K6W8_SCHJY|nr:STE/STE11/CDC15 protein kinase Cdc7 [Schizosaccharomyces japonicus yFS275]EEB09272.2 STE/STE11/CDC15 protein kinase Cdc7 [Schizosaccharomyces japonicus yFS275]